MELVEVRLPTSKKETPKDWFKNLLGAFECLESLWSKKCGGCKEVKILKKFSKGGQSDGRSFSCKECVKTYLNSYRPNHREDMVLWRIENKDRIRETGRAWYDKNKDRQKVLRKISGPKRAAVRMATDIGFKLKHNLRNRLWMAIKRDWKAGSAVNDLGCSIEFLKTYLEDKFHPGMTWENYGKKGWHIDHITPLDWFDLTNREQFLTASHHTNLDRKSVV